MQTAKYSGRSAVHRFLLIGLLSTLFCVMLGACSSKNEEAATSTAPAVPRNAPGSPVKAMNPRMADKATFGAKAEGTKRQTR